MSRSKLIIVGILVILSLILTIQNTQPVNTHLLFFTVTIPQAVLLLLMTLIGFAIGIFTVFHYIGRRKSMEQKDDT